MRFFSPFPPSLPFVPRISPARTCSPWRPPPSSPGTEPAACTGLGGPSRPGTLKTNRLPCSYPFSRSFSPPPSPQRCPLPPSPARPPWTRPAPTAGPGCPSSSSSSASSSSASFSSSSYLSCRPSCSGAVPAPSARRGGRDRGAGEVPALPALPELETKVKLETYVHCITLASPPFAFRPARATLAASDWDPASEDRLRVTDTN